MARPLVVVSRLLSFLLVPATAFVVRSHIAKPHSPPYHHYTAVMAADATGGEGTIGAAAAACVWSPETALLDIDPEDLASPPLAGSTALPRLAKDADFASSVQRAWRDEIENRPAIADGGRGALKAVGAAVQYKSEGGGTVLYGHAVRPRSSSSGKGTALLPGILLFHTGAGPQDIFLRWKAESLVTDADLGGCVVFIADIISDGVGWAWDGNRSKYNAAREQVFRPNADGSGEREVLQRRIKAAVAALTSLEGVDSERLGALGFCMGGHPVLEIARMKEDCRGIKAVATFHGVFDGVDTLEGVSENSNEPRPHALICHGANDPFVKPQELQVCEKVFRQNGWEWELLQFDGVRHGFTNPAQNFNPSDSFAYNDHAATSSWDAARALLKRKLLIK